MTSQHRTRVGLTAALALASLAAAAPAGADPNPAQRVQSSSRAGALAQEQYYMSHKPAIPASGHDFRTIDARELADAPGGTVTDVTASVTTEPASSSGFEWGDAAIGAGSALGLALVFAGGAAAITRRHRGATGSTATS
jgi:hypothetical protein